MARENAHIRKTIKKWLPLMENVGKSINRKGVVKVYQSPEKLAEDIGQAKVEVVIETIFQFVILDPKNQLTPLLNIWKKGQESYSGCIFSRADSSEDIKAGIIGFEDPFSSSSFALPMLALSEQVDIKKISYINLKKVAKEQKVKRLQVLKDLKKSEKWHYIFAGSDETSLHWLKRGYLDYIGLPCKEEKNKTLKVVARSVNVPRLIFATHKKLPSQEQSDIQRYLEKVDVGEKFVKKPTKATKITRLSKDEIEIFTSTKEKLLRIWQKVEDEL